MIAIGKVTARKRTLGARIVLACLMVIVGFGGTVAPAHALDNDYTWSKLAYPDVYPTQTATSANGQDSVMVGDMAAISHDKGQTWQSLTDTLAAVPGNDATIYWGGAAMMSADGQKIGLLNSDGQLAWSSDGGTTWSLKTTPMTSISSAAMSADGTKIVAVAGTQWATSPVYLSTDSGATWSQVGPTAGYQTIVMSADGQKILASVESNDYSPGADSGIYQSTDGGTTWTLNAATGPLGLYNLRLSANGQVAVAQSYDGTAQLSTDSGTTWSQVHAAPVTGSDYQYNIYVSADGGTVLLFDGYTRFKSTDHGSTWTTQPSNEEVYIRGGPGSSSADLSVLLAGESDYGDLYASQDGGTTWKIPLFQGSKWWAGAATSTDGSTVLLTDADGHIYYSHDHGMTWHFGYGVNDDGDNTGGDLWGTAVSADGSHMVVTDDSNRGTPHIYTSSDGGITWAKNIAAGTQDWYDVALSADGQKITAITLSGDVYISTDFGASWTKNTTLEHGFPAPSGGTSVQVDVSMSPDGTHLVVSENMLSSSYNNTTSSWVYAGTSHLYTSSDGGMSWTMRATPVDSGTDVIGPTAISGNGATVGFMTYGLHADLYLSRDGGATWTKNPGTGLDDGGYIISMSDDGQVIATNNRGNSAAYVTTDGGSTWKAYVNGSSGSGVSPIAVSGDGSQMYSATNNVFRGALPGTDTGSAPDSSLPSSPKNVTATPTSTTDLKVTWQAPADAGSSPLTGYHVQYKKTGASTWTPAGDTSPSTLSYTIAGLSPTTAYDIQVVAITALGASTDVPAQANNAITTATTLKPGETVSSDDHDLANTGADVWAVAAVGAIILISGMAALRLSVRRRKV